MFASAASIISTVNLNDVDLNRRFGGIARLYGAVALTRFLQAHVCVIGVGGVGSWAVEALARSAIGNLTMIDLDNLAESNVNRQIHALTSTLGQAKVMALAARVAQINPYCRITEVEDFITVDNLEEMIGGDCYDYVIDAIDNVRVKAALIAYCRKKGIALITIGGAGGQIDPTRIEIRDLARTEQEPLLAKVRKLLRSQYGFPRGDKSRFGIDAVFSTEPLSLPINEQACATKIEMSTAVTGLNCAGYGSTMTVTASFGLVAVAYVLRKLAIDAKAELMSGSTSTSHTN